MSKAFVSGVGLGKLKCAGEYSTFNKSYPISRTIDKKFAYWLRVSLSGSQFYEYAIENNELTVVAQGGGVYSGLTVNISGDTLSIATTLPNTQIAIFVRAYLE